MAWAPRLFHSTGPALGPLTAAALPGTPPSCSLSLLSPAPLSACCPSSHFPPSFLCASFFCRSLKPPSFITLWTGSRYCAALTLQGASARAGVRPPAPGRSGHGPCEGGGPATPPRADRAPEAMTAPPGKALGAALGGVATPSLLGARGRAALTLRAGATSQDPPGCHRPCPLCLAESRPNPARGS